LGLVIFRLYCFLPATEKTSAEAVPVSHPLEPATSPPPATAVERITVRNGQKIKIIPVEEILYLQADGDYVSIRTAEGRWLKEQTMKYSEEILPADRFVRIHRSYIVNITHISRIERYGEQQSIILHNGERIRISSARYQLLRRRLDI
jgi:DNA-binding LytR/AlgR family response regulator